MENKIIEVPIESIKPFERNPRINEGAVESVQKSIEKFGYNQPIIVNQDMVICAGHTRYQALKNLGYKTVNVMQKEMTPQEFMAYNIADNKTHEKSAWNFDLLTENLLALKGDPLLNFTGFDENELIEIFNNDTNFLELPEEKETTDSTIDKFTVYFKTRDLYTEFMERLNVLKNEHSIQDPNDLIIHLILK